jgi:hypothetical protein
MTRTQLFLTLSIVICATAPCADGMAAAPTAGPPLSDTLWQGVDEARAIAASVDGNIARGVAWAPAALIAWRYGGLVLALLRRATGRRRPSLLRTCVGGFPASGVAVGVPPLARPGPRPRPPRAPFGAAGAGR